ncbi:MAG: MFS transporter, partial [Alicyclobacillus sp.]|nr:MFS transporter [Alicyclobacillus sp.]
MQAPVTPAKSHAPLDNVRRVNWPLTVAVLFIGNVLLWSDRTNFSVATAVWQKDFHWSPSTVGLMLSAFSFGYMLLQPIGGYLSDRLGSRRMITLSCGGWSLFTLLTPLNPAALGLTAAFRALIGVLEAPFIPTITTTVAQAVPDRSKRGLYTAFMQSGSKLGPAIGTSAAGVLAAAWGPTSIFVVFGGVGVLIALAWWVYARNRQDFVAERAAASATPSESAQRAQEPDFTIRQLLSSGTVWALMVAYFSVPYCTFLFLTWLPIYLSNVRHFHLVQAGFLSSLPYLAAFVAYLFAGWISD